MNYKPITIHTHMCHSKRDQILMGHLAFSGMLPFPWPGEMFPIPANNQSKADKN
jgi:hypothetical protein